MPKNNSKARKDQRKDRADSNEIKKLYRDCGHWHTDNGMQKCPYGKGQ